MHVYVHWSSAHVMRCHEMFSCVVPHILGAWCILHGQNSIFNQIPDPKISHLHRSRSLSFYGSIANAHYRFIVTGAGGSVCPNLSKTRPKIRACFVFKNNTPNSASAADDKTNFRISHSESIWPLSQISLFLCGNHQMKTCPPARLRPRDVER